MAYTQLTHSVLPHGGPPAVPPVPHQPLHAGAQPRQPGRHGTGRGPRLPAPHPVRGDAAPTPGSPSAPRASARRWCSTSSSGAPWWRSWSPTASGSRRAHGAGLDVGLDPGAGGRRRGRGAARRLRRPVLPADPGPGAGQPDHPRGGRAHPLPRRRPVHLPRRAAGAPLRRADGGPAPAWPGPVGWAAANWLLDAASLWVFVAAFGHVISPVDLLTAYGLANILAAMPITPGGSAWSSSSWCRCSPASA